jgi:hypothetical protein
MLATERELIRVCECVFMCDMPNVNLRSLDGNSWDVMSVGVCVYQSVTVIIGFGKHQECSTCA